MRLVTAQTGTQDIYLQHDLNSKDSRESIVKVTKYLQKATQMFNKDKTSGRFKHQSERK